MSLELRFLCTCSCRHLSWVVTSCAKALINSAQHSLSLDWQTYEVEKRAIR